MSAKTKATKLKPCPFCHTAAHCYQYIIDAKVWCKNLKCQAAIVAKELDIAVERWNHRKSQPRRAI